MRDNVRINIRRPLPNALKMIFLWSRFCLVPSAFSCAHDAYILMLISRTRPLCSCGPVPFLFLFCFSWLRFGQSVVQISVLYLVSALPPPVVNMADAPAQQTQADQPRNRGRGHQLVEGKRSVKQRLDDLETRVDSQESNTGPKIHQSGVAVADFFATKIVIASWQNRYLWPVSLRRAKNISCCMI